MQTRRVWPALLNIDPDDPSLNWAPFRDGVDIVPILSTSSGSSSALLRYQPGAAMARHCHVGHEYILVLCGSQSDEHGHYARGSMVVNAPGSNHAVRSDEGCVVLAIWEQPVRFD